MNVTPVIKPQGPLEMGARPEFNTGEEWRAWWRSDEAFEARSALYLGHVLFHDKGNRRLEFSTKNAPDWPAVFFYSVNDDMPYWVECRSPVHCRDYRRSARAMDMNPAARALAKTE